MKIWKSILLLITCLLFFATASTVIGADIAKIGIVDFQKVFEVSDAGKLAQVEINKQGKKMEDDLKKKEVEIKELQKKFEREALVMNEDVRSKKERAFRIKVNDFKSLTKKYQADFKMLNGKLVNFLKKEVLDIVDEMGKNEGYLIILEKKEGGVLYFPNTIDITDQLIQIYNTRLAKKSVEKR